LARLLGIESQGLTSACHAAAPLRPGTGAVGWTKEKSGLVPPPSSIFMPSRIGRVARAPGLRPNRSSGYQGPRQPPTGVPDCPLVRICRRNHRYTKRRGLSRRRSGDIADSKTNQLCPLASLASPIWSRRSAPSSVAWPGRRVHCRKGRHQRGRAQPGRQAEQAEEQAEGTFYASYYST
jgi:hypothetical protein